MKTSYVFITQHNPYATQDTTYTDIYNAIQTNSQTFNTLFASKLSSIPPSITYDTP